MLDGSGSLPVLGMPGRCCAAPRRPAGWSGARGSPIAGTAPTAGCCRATARCAARGRRRDRRPGAASSATARGLLCLHGDSPGAVDHARRRPPGSGGARMDAARPLSGRRVSSSTGRSRNAVEKPANLWRYPRVLWSNLWDQKNVEISPENPLRSFRSQGIELSHRSTAGKPQGGTAGRSGIRQERRSTPRGDLRRRPGDGDGGVGEPVRSRGASPSLLKPRASWCSYHREALTLLPPGPALPAHGWTESRPACRTGAGLDSFRRFCRGTREPGSPPVRRR